jgi:Zn-finger nucleic acid-binding protein
MTDIVCCPNCSNAMEQRHLERYDGGDLAIDLCFPCRVIWFDAMQSPQLAAGAVMELLQMIRGEGAAQWQSLRADLACPHCGSPLLRTDDLVKGGRIRYFRCPQDRGRLTPFLQFLIEKQFVRVVTPQEISRLRLDVRQASCSGCGAPIDLARQDHCEHCHAPITVLDADAVERAARFWSERAELRANGRALAEKDIAQLRNVEQWNLGEGGDLLQHSIGMIGG